MQTAIVGGGAAGFFLAVNLKEMMPQMEVVILERSTKVLRKVAISGGGRCNCTNTFEDVKDLSAVYPRGHRLLRRLFHEFGPADAYSWFERHGVALTVQADHCVFPASQRSQTIIDCLCGNARRLGVKVVTGLPVNSLEELRDFDFIAVTTGGSPREERLRWLADAGHSVQKPVPSLFTFSIADEALRALMGTVADDATAFIPATKHRARGPLLITHWGMSGPAILKLSSYAARPLHDANYRLPLAINWTSHNETEVAAQLQALAADHPHRQLSTVSPFSLPSRLWTYLLGKSLNGKIALRWGDVGRKDLNRLTNALCNDAYQIDGRAAFKDEFVTCGGIDLSQVNPSTLESRVVPRLFFAGEVLDIDGITGGFNFQAAWTTAYVAAKSIAAQL